MEKDCVVTAFDNGYKIEKSFIATTVGGSYTITNDEIRGLRANYIAYDDTWSIGESQPIGMARVDWPIPPVHDFSSFTFTKEEERIDYTVELL